jgi:phosphoribosylcarboxyaminoimidazole (NCAIR) mutase
MAHPFGEDVLNVDVVLGSKSDREQVLNGLLRLEDNPKVNLRVHVISCHRNCKTLLVYATACTADLVIAAAGMAAHLPGMLKTFLDWLQAYRDVPVIGVGMQGKNARQTIAATSSIDQVPGHPVIVQADGKAYRGASGFTEVCGLVSAFSHIPIGGDHLTWTKAERRLSHLPPERPPEGKEAIIDWDWENA